MIYSFESRVRYSEIGEDQNITLNSIINYFQDCSTFQSEALDIGLDKLEKNHQVWLLLSWQICVNRYPKFGEKIRVKTWAYDFKNFYGYRNFTLEDEHGEVAAYANSVWGFMDLESQSMMKVPMEEVDSYGLEKPYPMEYAGRKVRVPKDSEEKEHFTVRKYHLDTNHHVNNGQYVQMAREFIPENIKINQMRAEYKIQAHLGDEIIPKVHEENGTYTVSLYNTEGKAYVAVEFS